jgi:BirA family biotin operon repressor/biotin-[acetyl-CoA-carboxylase] ligase
MLIVDDPAVFQKELPGFLPRTLGLAGSLAGGHGVNPFHLSLGEALFGSLEQPLMVADRPEGNLSDFWTFWHLAARSGVSQYDTLRRVIADTQDLPGHGVCLALSGREFHGQQGRSWQAVPGNLHLSLALRCDLDAADCGLALTMLPAVAVMDALSGLGWSGAGSGELGIKWVNDILIGGRKVGGVLTSARSQDGRIGSCVLGIGLNVAVAPDVAPTAFTPGITCLKDHFNLPAEGLAGVLWAVLHGVSTRFDQLTDQGPGPLLAAYRSVSLILGKRVEIQPDENSSQPRRKGRVLEIGPNLALTLDDDPMPVTSGRLVLPPEND